MVKKLKSKKHRTFSTLSHLQGEYLKNPNAAYPFFVSNNIDRDINKVMHRRCETSISAPKDLTSVYDFLSQEI